MTIVLSFANQKGGVGKTTLSTQLAYYLRLRKGKRVLFVDMDAQASATQTLTEGGEQEGTRSDDLFKNRLDEITVQETSRGIDLIGSSPDADAYDVDALPLERALNPKKHLKAISDEYDYIIVDCPPSLGRRLVAALILTDYVISPIKLSGFAVTGLVSLSQTIEDIRKQANRRMKFLGVAINEFVDNGPQRDALAAVREQLPKLLFNTVVKFRAPIDQASEGMPVSSARNGLRAAKELEELFEEILGRIEKDRSVE